MQFDRQPANFCKLWHGTEKPRVNQMIVKSSWLEDPSKIDRACLFPIRACWKFYWNNYIPVDIFLLLTKCNLWKKKRKKKDLIGHALAKKYRACSRHITWTKVCIRCTLHACYMNVAWTYTCPTWFWGDVWTCTIHIMCILLHVHATCICYVHIIACACKCMLHACACYLHGCMLLPSALARGY